MALSRKDVLREIRRLEDVIENQGNEIVSLEVERDLAIEKAQEIAGVSFQLREDEVAERLDYRDTNGRLVKFIEKVADSHSKFRKEARSLLGL